MRETPGTKNETSMTNQNEFAEQERYTVTEEETASSNGKPAILYSEDYTVEGEELEAENKLSEKKGFFKGKKGRKRKKRLRIAAVLLVLVIIGVVVGRTFLMRRARSNMTARSTVRSTMATIGSISTTVVGTGTLSAGDAEDVVVPSGIKIDEVLVEAGDIVKKGDTLATVNEASVASALLEIEENLDDVNDQIDDLSDDADEEGTTEYLEAIVLRSEKKELKEAKTTLEELLETLTITASKAGIIEAVYATEGEELTSSSNSGSSASVTASYSSTGSSTVTASYVSYSSTDFNTATASHASYSKSGFNITTASCANCSRSSSDAAGLRTDGAGTTTMDTTVALLSSDKTDQATRLASTSTESNSIEDCTLSITAPTTGATPETTLEDTDGFTGTISWSPADSIFQAETAYTATVILAAKDGYTFSEAVNVTISTASEVTTEISDDGSTLTITATFAATEALSSDSTASTASSSDSTTSSSSSTSSSDSTTSSGRSSSNSDGTTNGSGTSGNNTSGGSASGGNGASGSGSVSASGGSSMGSSSSGTSSSGDSSSGSSSASDYSVYEAVAFSIVDDDTAVISVSVDELDILSVEEGQTAVVTMDAVEEEEFEGTITSVSTTSSGDSSSAKYPVEITIEKTEDMMYGMSASVTINIDEATDAVLIPVDALQEEGSSTYVYTETDDDGNLSGRTEVTTGLSNGTQVAIASGLEEGDTVYYEEVSSDSGSESESSFSFDMNMGGGGDMPSGDRNSSGGSDSNGGGRGNGGGMNGAPSGNQ